MMFLSPISKELVQNEKLSFLVTEPFGFHPSYEFTISDALKEELHIEAEDQVIVLAVVSVQDNLTDATINLLAPLVIKHKSALGRCSGASRISNGLIRTNRHMLNQKYS